MATRALIGMIADMCADPAATPITYIYNHWDGSPEELGVTLRTHYFSCENVEALLAMGDVSMLRTSLDESTFYIRDLHEDPDGNEANSIEASDWYRIAALVNADFVHLYDASEEVWFHAEVRAKDLGPWVLTQRKEE
jgi:hypothetical protein